jgi:hypothetical protein
MVFPVCRITNGACGRKTLIVIQVLEVHVIEISAAQNSALDQNYIQPISIMKRNLNEIKKNLTPTIKHGKKTPQMSRT